MTLGYALKLGLKIRSITVKAYKIDDFIFKMFKMFFASFQIKNKLRKSRFF